MKDLCKALSVTRKSTINEELRVRKQVCIALWRRCLFYWANSCLGIILGSIGSRLIPNISQFLTQFFIPPCLIAMSKPAPSLLQLRPLPAQFFRDPLRKLMPSVDDRLDRKHNDEAKKDEEANTSFHRITIASLLFKSIPP